MPLKRERGGVVTLTIRKASGQDAPRCLFRTIMEESGFSVKGCIIFILFVALSVFLAIHLIRPSYCSGRFKTEIEGIAIDGFSKSDGQIAEEIRSQAEKLGIVVGERDVAIYWGPGRESVNIKIDYSYPVDLLLYRYNRHYSYEIDKRLSYPKRMIDQTNKRLQGSQHRMLERARKAKEKLED